ncbi:hypothetical protein [Streptomyces sp. NBC_01538]|uniref:hypothetical protein n=1 Tax=Streptomyces sp. NBC_01538 TaxID=2903897 RepID=UPI00386FF125
MGSDAPLDSGTGAGVVPGNPNHAESQHARIVLDPGVYTYCTASVLLITLYGSVFAVPADAVRGLVRLGFGTVFTAYVLCRPVRDRRCRPAVPGAALA